MKVRITTNAAIVEAEGDAVECESFVRSLRSPPTTAFVMNPSGYITARDVAKGITDALEAARRR